MSDLPRSRVGRRQFLTACSDYYAIGFEFGQGSYRAGGSVLTVEEVKEHRKLARELTELEPSELILDFESTLDPKLREFVSGEQYLYTAGAIGPTNVDDSAQPYVLPEEFDCLAFVEETTAAHRVTV